VVRRVQAASGGRLVRDDEPLGLLEDREPNMGGEPRPEPERAHLLAADAFVPQPELDHVRE